MTHQKIVIGVVIPLITISLWVIIPQNNHISAQPRITNTPVPVVIPSTAPTATPGAPANNAVQVSPSPTFTPTEPLPNVTMSSVVAAGSALIRDFPESGSIIGALSNETQYQVTGQYFSWIQFQYSQAPSGRAWTYIENVRLTGNLDQIPYIDPNSQPAQAAPEDNATATALALLQTPGFAETATANARVIDAPDDATNQAIQATIENPTYTPPAEIVALRPTQVANAIITETPDTNFVDNTVQSVAEGDVPPFIPIVGLALFGAFGLLLALIRR